MKISSVLSSILAGAMIVGTLASCSNEAFPEDNRNIVSEFIRHSNPDNEMVDVIADLNNLEALTELSSHIVLCTVESLDNVEYDDNMGEFTFDYSVKINDILMNVSGELKTGDTIKVSSVEGILKALDAAKMVKDYPRSKKLGILQGEYTEEDYVISSNYNAIPIEVGHSYVMLLSDEYLESNGIYVESGRMYLYEYSGNAIRSGYREKATIEAKSDIIEMLSDQISKRTGRADEIGKFGYMWELGRQQFGNAVESDLVE